MKDKHRTYNPTLKTKAGVKKPGFCFNMASLVRGNQCIHRSDDGNLLLYFMQRSRFVIG